MSNHTNHPMALPPPGSPVTVIDEALLAAAAEAARTSPRKRIILPLHKQGGASLQRMLNVLEPGTYIRPHRHSADRAESIIVLSGAIRYFTFDERGKVQQAAELAAGAKQFGIDTEGGIWHSFLVLASGTVLFEVKPGPYDAAADKTFAPWAPEEYSPAAENYLQELLQYSTTSR